MQRNFRHQENNLPEHLLLKPCTNTCTIVHCTLYNWQACSSTHWLSDSLRQLATWQSQLLASTSLSLFVLVFLFLSVFVSKIVSKCVSVVLSAFAWVSTTHGVSADNPLQTSSGGSTLNVCFSLSVFPSKFVFVFSDQISVQICFCTTHSQLTPLPASTLNVCFCHAGFKYIQTCFHQKRQLPEFNHTHAKMWGWLVRSALWWTKSHIPPCSLLWNKVVFTQSAPLPVCSPWNGETNRTTDLQKVICFAKMTKMVKNSKKKREKMVENVQIGKKNCQKLFQKCFRTVKNCQKW